MKFAIKETIKKRKSVRTYDGTPLKDADITALKGFIDNVTDPFGIPVEFGLLKADDHDLSSPVVRGEDHYLTAKVKKEGNFELSLGYSFETVCLYAASLGLGTVIMAASISRNTFEKAMNLQDDEVLPVASPLGYAAKEMSFRETLMRKGTKADHRIPFEKLFFDGSFDTSLTMGKAGGFAQALEMLRWAPSAVNKQPWRAVVIGDMVHFYEKKSIKDNSNGDIQKVDMGIALAHFDLTMHEEKKSGSFIFEDPGITVPANVHYIVSYRKEK